MANGSLSLGTSTYLTLGATQLEPVILWAMNGFPKPVPSAVVSIIAVAIVAALHIAQKIMVVKFGPSADVLDDTAPAVSAQTAPTPAKT